MHIIIIFKCTHRSNVNGLYAIQHKYKHDINCIIESTSIPVRLSHYGTPHNHPILLDDVVIEDREYVLEDNMVLYVWIMSLQRAKLYLLSAHNLVSHHIVSTQPDHIRTIFEL